MIFVGNNMSKQCPRCGSTVEEKKFMGSFCIDCYLSMNMPALPAKITIYKCKSCGTERFTAWTTPAEVAIAHELKNKKFGTPDVWIEGRQIVVKYDKLDKLDMEFRVPLRMKDSICNICSQRSAGYYEAIIQLRGKYAHDSVFAEKIIAHLERLTFIPKTEMLKEGLDIYVGSKAAVATILSALNFKPVTSNKLYGVKEGQRVYRTTFLIRG